MKYMIPNSLTPFLFVRCAYIFGANGNIQHFTKDMQDQLVTDVIEPMACNGLRTISIAYKDFVPSSAAENEVSRMSCTFRF